jgi:hypothetical protein
MKSPNPTTLKELLQHFFDGVSIGNLDTHRVTLGAAVSMGKIMQDKPGDYIIFDNGGGNAFDVWEGDALVDSILEDPSTRAWVHAFQLRGEVTIWKVPVSVQAQYIQWVAPDVELIDERRWQCPT